MEKRDRTAVKPSNGPKGKRNPTGGGLIPDLIQQIEMFGLIFDCIYNGVMVTDADGYITHFNKPYGQFLGLDPEEQIGKHCTQVIENTRMHIVAQTGEPEINHSHRIMGQNMVVQRIPIKNNGRVIAVFGQVMFKDVTDVRKLAAELSLLESKVKLYEEELINLRSTHYTFESIIGTSASIKALIVEARQAAARLLKAVDSQIAFYGGLETLFFGISLGSILVLAAIGLAITFGVMGVINMAHGELIMLGAYTTFVVQQAMPQAIGWSLLVAVPAAFLVSGAVGIAIERTVIRHLYGRPLETLLATFGVSLILQQAVRMIFSANNRAVVTPEWMSGSLVINDFLSLTYNRLYVVAFCLLVFGALLLILRRTRLGLEVRAVSQNRAMAQAMGIRSGRVDAMTFGLGSGIAGIAGVALSQLTNVGPNLGQAYIVDSFMVVVFGGVGNLWGTLIGGMSLGIGNKLIEPWAGAVMAKILVLVFIILFIQKRPRGLFPQKGRAAEG